MTVEILAKQATNNLKPHCLTLLLRNYNLQRFHIHYTNSQSRTTQYRSLRHAKVQPETNRYSAPVLNSLLKSNMANPKTAASKMADKDAPDQDKPDQYECPEAGCTRSFDNKGALAYHICLLNHVGPLTIPYRLSYRRILRALGNVNLVDAGDKKYECDACGRLFRRYQSILRHMASSKHGLQE